VDGRPTNACNILIGIPENNRSFTTLQRRRHNDIKMGLKETVSKFILCGWMVQDGV
jgi:hypothetical protein